MWLHSYFPITKDKSFESTKASKRLAEFENNRQFQDNFVRMINLVLNLFEWENLPDTCNEYFFEEIMLFHGYACIIEDKNLGFLTLPCTPIQAQNLYYENSYYKAYSINYNHPFMALTKYNKDIFYKLIPDDSRLKAERGVVCMDNPEKYSMIETIAIFAEKRTDAMRTIDVLGKLLKTPSIVETDEDSKVALINAMAAIEQNALTVYAGKNIAKTLKETKVMPTGMNSDILMAAWDNLNNIDSQFYTAFGINNLNTADKKERLITNEVDSNDEQIALNIYYRLDQRKHFCEQFNFVFGTNIDCNIRHQTVQTTVNQEGGKENGELYNNAE